MCAYNADLLRLPPNHWWARRRREREAWLKAVTAPGGVKRETKGE